MEQHAAESGQGQLPARDLAKTSIKPGIAPAGTAVRKRMRKKAAKHKSMKPKADHQAVLHELSSISAEEIIEPMQLRETLLGRHGAAASFVIDTLDSTVGQGLRQWSLHPQGRAQLQALLAQGLTQLLPTVGLYQPERFADVELRQETQRLLRTPLAGMMLKRVNKMLLQDSFKKMLQPKARTLLEAFEEQDVAFRLYVEEGRQPNGTARVSFRLVFKCPDKGWTSRVTTSEQEARDLAKTLVNIIKTNTRTHNHKEQRVRNKTYDEMMTLAGIAPSLCPEQAAEELKQLVKDASEARRVIGGAEQLFGFCNRALPLVPALERRVELSAALSSFNVFYGLKKRRDHRWEKETLGILERFGKEAPACIRLAAQFEVEVAKQFYCDRRLFWQLLDSLALGEPPPSKAGEETCFVDEVRPLAIALWLKRMGGGWKRQRDCLIIVRSFSTYVRDVLAGLAAKPVPTPADAVPTPVQLATKDEIKIVPVIHVWELLLNLQDLDSAIAFAMRNYAGFHLEEALKFDIKKHVVWDKGQPTQIEVLPGFGKETNGRRTKRMVNILYPLDQLLILRREQSAEGKIIQRRSSADSKLMRLVKRLEIDWVPSIQRHNFASYLKGSGKDLQHVAGEMGDTPERVLNNYLRVIPKSEAMPFWTVPVDISHFKKLPWQKRNWDWNAPLIPAPQPASARDQ